MELTLSPRRSSISRGLPFAALQRSYIALTFLFIAGAFGLLYMSLAPGAGAFEDRQGGTPVLQAISLALYSPALVFLLIYHDAAWRVLRKAWPLSLLVALAVVSIFWSVEPGVALRRSAAMTLMFFFSLYVAMCFTPRQFLTLAVYLCMGMFLASLLAVALPGVGLDPLGPYAGYVRGIFQEKNQFGRFAGLALLMLFPFIMARGQPVWERTLMILAVVVGLGLLWFANARTPLLTFFLGLGGLWAARFIYYPVGWQRRLHGTMRAGIVGFLTFLGIVIVPIIAVSLIYLLGRDLTLTGRLKLWDYAIAIGWDRPWLGAGFKSFWTDALTFDLRSLHEYWEIEGAAAKNLTANAHNGYLDIWLELGFVGLGLFALFLISYVVKTLQILKRSTDPLSIWYVGTFLFMISYYLTNSEVMAHSDIGWFLLSYAFLSLSASQVTAAALQSHKREVAAQPSSDL